MGSGFKSHKEKSEIIKLSDSHLKGKSNYVVAGFFN